MHIYEGADVTYGLLFGDQRVWCVYLVVGDEDCLAEVVVHGRHRLGALVEDQVHLPLHLLTVWDPPDQVLHNLTISPDMCQNEIGLRDRLTS